MSEEVKIDVNIPSNAKDLALMYLGTASKMELKYLEYLLTQFTKSKDQQIKDLEELLVLADNVLMYSKDRPPLDSNHYYDKKQSYQQKYHKP